MENQWQPIETAPKGTDTRILVFIGDEGFEIKEVQIENTNNYRYYDWNGFTHWMPLPKPPVINN